MKGPAPQGLWPLLLLHLLAMVGLSSFLRLEGCGWDSILLILLAWILLAGGWLLRQHLLRRAEANKLRDLAANLPEPYLIGQVMAPPARQEDQIYHQLLQEASRSALEALGDLRREQQAYQTYIQQWVHEVKTPIAAMTLLCQNHPSDTTPDLLAALEQMERCTEQALFYARSEHTEKDYFIGEFPLFEAVHQAIAQNKYLLLQKGARLRVEETPVTVFSDKKWIVFLLNQLIGNAVKYTLQTPALTFSAQQAGDKVLLSLRDNGMGIPPEDLPRIFDKGFTGQNGRRAAPSSTGLGLYLCRRLCDKLDIGLQARSSPEGTTMTLAFRANDFIRQARPE